MLLLREDMSNKPRCQLESQVRIKGLLDPKINFHFFRCRCPNPGAGDVFQSAVLGLALLRCARRQRHSPVIWTRIVPDTAYRCTTALSCLPLPSPRWLTWTWINSCRSYCSHCKWHFIPFAGRRRGVGDRDRDCHAAGRQQCSAAPAPAPEPRPWKDPTELAQDLQQTPPWKEALTWDTQESSFVPTVAPC